MTRTRLVFFGVALWLLTSVATRPGTAFQWFARGVLPTVVLVAIVVFFVRGGRGLWRWLRGVVPE